LLGKRTPRVDRVGVQKLYSGRALYMHQNMINSRVSLALQAEPPSLGVSTAFDRVTISCISGVVTLRCFRAGNTGTGWAIAYCARAHASSGWSAKVFRLVIGFQFTTNQVVNISPQFYLNLGAPVVGELIAVRVRTRFDNCLWSSEVEANAQAV
jgi:hypothetical protein